MNITLGCLCDRVDRLTEKWRPFVQGRQQMKVTLSRADTGEPVSSRVLTTEECRVMAHAEIEPVINAALKLAERAHEN